MKRIPQEKRQWLNNRRRKIERNRHRISNRSQHRNPEQFVGLQNSNDSTSGCCVLKAPENFSLMDNLEETLQYFHKVEEAIRKAHNGQTLFFDLSTILHASPDAFMYIIAILKNNQRLSMLHIPCAGNEPIAEEPRSVLHRAGFFNYVKSSRFHAQEKEEAHLRIYRGNRSDPLLAKKLCDFVHMRSNGSVDRVGTKRLYPMFIELMNNTKQHAFEENANVFSQGFYNWYTYAEDLGNRIRFVFLDTGRGIPATIRKKWYEKIPMMSNDASFISSALEGCFRTNTGLEHRGKGLPEIYENVKSHAIDTLRIISCKGLCTIESTGEIIEKVLPCSFNGTMYIWTLKKEIAA